MRTDEAANLFYETSVKKASKHEFIESPALPRKRKRPDYKTMEQHFQVDGYHYNAEAHHPATPKDHFRSIYFESLDIISTSIKARFEQPSFKAFLKLESFLLKSINNDSIDEEVMVFLKTTYSDDVNVDALQVEIAVLKAMLKDSEINCFRDVFKSVKEKRESEKNLIPNTIKLIELLLANPATSCIPERSFSTARRLKTWLRSTMKNKRFNVLAILQIHKDLTDDIDLVGVGNEFVSLHSSRYQYFGKFEESDFI